jgi:pyridoxine 5-phosphate synthase
VKIVVKLGVNIDHVATLRQARRGLEPEPVTAALLAELAGADWITIHLREDRRHIQDRDVDRLKEVLQIGLDFEMSVAPDIVKKALATRPHFATLVPERREEITTEGGLDVLGQKEIIKGVLQTLKEAGIEVSLFVDPDPEVIQASAELGADAIELHTGAYANAVRNEDIQKELTRLQNAARQAAQLGLHVFAGHGLNYRNVVPIARIPEMEALNIGHSIISRSVFVGIERAVREMIQLIR